MEAPALDAEEWFRTLAVASLADGALDPREAAILLRCSAWLGLPFPRARSIVAEVRSGGAAPEGAVPQLPEQRRRLFGSVLDIVLADGRLTDEEARCVHGIAVRLGIPPDEESVMFSTAQARWRYFSARTLPPGPAGELAPPIEKGTLVGEHFRVAALLGEGGFAAVYRAHHEVLGVDVALKLLLPQTLVKNPAAERRFLQEARMGRTFAHRYIPSVREVGRDPLRGPYMAMDLVSGPTLEHILREDGPQPLERVLRIGLQALEALEEVHRAGIIHRDVKTGNLMLAESFTGEEEVRLIDFGISKASWSHPDDPRATTDGMVMGSLTYMSPEQVQGHKLDARSDLYSLAVVLYEALCGCLPYEVVPDAEDLCRAMIVRIVLEPPRDPLVIYPDLPRALGDALLRALAKNPDERPASARVFRELLAGAAPC